VVEVVGRGIAGRGGLVNDREGAAGGGAGGFDDVERAVEPPGSAFAGGERHEYGFRDHRGAPGAGMGADQCTPGGEGVHVSVILSEIISKYLRPRCAHVSSWRVQRVRDGKR